jgi:hypothetical protein
MMRIRKFNESNNDIKREDIIRFVNEIRECCLDFEDDELISYIFYTKLSFSFFGNNSYQLFNSIFVPNSNDFDRWIESIMIDLPNSGIDFGIKLSLKIPEIKNGMLTKDGISRLDDIITISRRLESLDFEVSMDLNGKHEKYKPVELYVLYPDF